MDEEETKIKTMVISLDDFILKPSSSGTDIEVKGRKLIDVMSRLKYAFERFDFYSHAENPEYLVAFAQAELDYFTGEKAPFAYKLLHDLECFRDYLNPVLLASYRREITYGLRTLWSIAAGRNFTRPFGLKK